MSVQADQTAPVTALDVLGTGQDPTAAVRAWLGTADGHDSHRDPLFHLSDTTRDEAVRQIGEALTLHLGRIDIGTLVLKGWSSYEALTCAGQQTAADPNSRQVVEVAAHTMEWTDHLAVHVAVDGVAVGQIDLEVKVDLAIQGLVAVVGGGRLLTLRSGHADTTVTVGIGPDQHTSDPVTVDLSRLIVIPLGRGIPLVHTAP